MIKTIQITITHDSLVCLSELHLAMGHTYDWWKKFVAEQNLTEYGNRGNTTYHFGDVDRAYRESMNNRPSARNMNEQQPA